MEKKIKDLVYKMSFIDLTLRRAYVKERCAEFKNSRDSTARDYWNAWETAIEEELERLFTRPVPIPY